MARRKKTPTPKTVREIRKKVEHDQLQMGAGKVPKDETRKLTKQVEQIKTSKTRQRVNAEEVRARKGHNIVDKDTAGRKSTKGIARKTETEKEYTHELQKIRNRLKYRERQGFFIKWETLPTRPTRITQQDVEKLKQYEVQMNELGEIGVVRTEYSEYAQEVPQKLRLKYTDLPNYSLDNDSNFVPPDESVQNFDVFDRIEARLIYCYSLVQNSGTVLDHPMDEARWIELSNDVEEAYGEAIALLRRTKESPRKQEYADYLVANEDVIMSAIDTLLEVSDDDQLREAKPELLRYLELH